MCTLTLLFCYSAALSTFLQVHRHVTSAVKNKFSPSSDMSIHPSTEEKIIVSFPEHEAAILALRAANQGRDLFIDSVPYSFQLNHTVCQKQIIKNKSNDSARRAAAPSFASFIYLAPIAYNGIHSRVDLESSCPAVLIRHYSRRLHARAEESSGAAEAPGSGQHLRVGGGAGRARRRAG
jgi:hypothetical protein